MDSRSSHRTVKNNTSHASNEINNGESKENGECYQKINIWPFFSGKTAASLSTFVGTQKSSITVYIFGICKPGASFFYLGPKILSTKRATFQIGPRKRPSETILFGVGLTGKYMCMCTEEEKGARIRWRISEAGECTSELPELTSRDCAQLVLGGRRARQLFFLTNGALACSSFTVVSVGFWAGG